MKIIVFYCFIAFVCFSCASSKKITRRVKFEEGYKVLRYFYRYDEATTDTGYWLYSSELVTLKLTVPLAGDVSHFANIFNCKQYEKLNAYIQSKKKDQRDSVTYLKNCYYVDMSNRDLYFILPLKGKFIFLEKSICKGHKDDLVKNSGKARCKYSPLPISSYPFFIPISYSYSDIPPIETIRMILKKPLLQKASLDSLNVFLCY